MIQLKRLAGDFLNLLFPALCNACCKSLFHGETLICTKCAYDLPYTDFQQYAENPVAKQFWGRIPVHAAMSMLYFDKGNKVQQLIHHLKYKDQTQLGILLGNKLGERIKNSPYYTGITTIVPVPLHPKRQRSRGYNQSKFIADGIAEVLKIPVDDQLLKRARATSTQTKKNRFNRFLNMQTVFVVKNPESLTQQHILLVDDVMTTGATLEACGLELLKHGTTKLSIVTLAYAK